MPVRRRIALGLAVALLLTAIAYAGADHPPPPGFIWAVLVIFAWSAAVTWAADSSWLWSAVVGAVAAAVLSLGLGSLIGLVVMLVLGAIGGLLVKGAADLLRRLDRQS